MRVYWYDWSATLCAYAGVCRCRWVRECVSVCESVRHATKWICAWTLSYVHKKCDISCLQCIIFFFTNFLFRPLTFHSTFPCTAISPAHHSIRSRSQGARPTYTCALNIIISSNGCIRLNRFILDRPEARIRYRCCIRIRIMGLTICLFLWREIYCTSMRLLCRQRLESHWNPHSVDLI